ncbi:MAG: metalloprotease PmbA [Pseudomonadota bacterium]
MDSKSETSETVGTAVASYDDERALLARLADGCIDQATESGASAVEVALGQGQGMSINVRNGEVETVEYNRDKSLSLTVYFGHHSGSASTTDFSEEAVSQVVSSACNIAKFTEEDPYNGLADADLMATDIPDLDLHHPWEIEMDQAVDLARRAEESALKADSRISNTEGGGFSSHSGTDLYANSHGFRGFSNGTRHGYSCSVLASDSNGMQRDYWYDSSRNASQLESPESVGKTAARRTVRRLGARKIETASHPVIFETGVSASLISHMISAISGSSLYRKASFLLDQKGEALFPDWVQIHERPLQRGAPSSSAFDAEGVATRDSDIVLEGTLARYILSSYSARKLGTRTTANAGGVRNLAVESNVTGGLQELMSLMGRGVLVTELIGFGVNTVTGDYSRGAFGFWVENGEIQYPVHEFTIAGNLINMYADFVGVADDFHPNRSSQVGSILIDKMAIACS